MPSDKLLAITIRDEQGLVVSESLVKRTNGYVETQLGRNPRPFTMEITNLGFHGSAKTRHVIVCIVNHQIVGSFVMVPSATVVLLGHQTPDRLIPFDYDSLKISIQVWECVVVGVREGRCSWPLCTSKLEAMEYSIDQKSARTLALKRISKDPMFVYQMNYSDKPFVNPLGHGFVMRTICLSNYVGENDPKLVKSVSVPHLKRVLSKKRQSMELGHLRQIFKKLDATGEL